MQLIHTIERFLSKNNPFLALKNSTHNHILLIPGMSAPAWQLLPLAHFLKKELPSATYTVSIVPLGYSWGSTDELLLITTTVIDTILNGNKTKKLIIIGHSHGGRVAWNAGSYVQNQYPHVQIQLITMATPLDYKPKLTIISSITNYFSLAFREWPNVHTLDVSKISFKALYSDTDMVVNADCAVSNIDKKYLQLLPGLAHFQFLDPKKTGAILKTLITH